MTATIRCALAAGLLGLATATADAASPEDERDAALLGKLVNEYRQRHGLAALVADEKLRAIAHEHSAYMAKAGRLSHDRFDQRFRASGFTLCVENVGWNYPTPAAQLAGWQRSPVHDRNLLDVRVKAMGIAYRARYVTWVACR